MQNFDRHFILYAKGWYKENNTIENLKILVGKRCEIDPEYCKIRDITRVLLSITFPYMGKGYNEKDDDLVMNYRTFLDFISDIDPNALKWNLPNSNYDFQTAIISKCLSILSLLNISDIPFDLGVPDANILPIKGLI